MSDLPYLLMQRSIQGNVRQSPQWSSLAVSVAGKKQACIPELSRHFSGAARFFVTKSVYHSPHPAFLALQTEIPCADCLIRGFRPILEAGEVLVPFRWDTLTSVLFTTEQAAL